MLVIKNYNRDRAQSYASAWAFSRNPLFSDFTGIGGDCTNFISQCVLAGSCRMNFTPIYGWYYLDANDRTASFTGVEYFYDFLVSNEGEGPFGREADPDECEVGDVIQLGRNGERYYHTLLIVGKEGDDFLVAAHSDDAYNRRLSDYRFDRARYLHIEGVRVEVAVREDCYLPLLRGEALLIVGSGIGLPNEPPGGDVPVPEEPPTRL